MIYPYLRLGGWKAKLARRGAAKAEGRLGGQIYDKYTNITRTPHNKYALVVHKKSIFIYLLYYMYTHIYIGLPVINGWGEKLGPGGLGWRSGRTGSLARRAALTARAGGAAQGCARWLGGVASWVRGMADWRAGLGRCPGPVALTRWRGELPCRPGLGAALGWRRCLTYGQVWSCGQAGPVAR